MTVMMGTQAPLQFEADMFKATCKLFLSTFWEKGVDALKAEPRVPLKMPLLQKLAKVGFQLRRLQNGDHPAMMDDMHVQVRSKGNFLTSHYGPEKCAAAARRPEFLQDTSHAAVQATAVQMRLAVERLAKEPRDDRCPDIVHEYWFADFAWHEWLGQTYEKWTPPTREAGRDSDTE